MGELVGIKQVKPIIDKDIIITKIPVIVDKKTFTKLLGTRFAIPARLPANSSIQAWGNEELYPLMQSIVDSGAAEFHVQPPSDTIFIVDEEEVKELIESGNYELATKEDKEKGE
jgi:hypothetical protein